MTMTMTTSPAGRAALTQREGCRLTAYSDSVGVPTIGIGHTGRAGPPAVSLGMTITPAEADEIFGHDLRPFEEAVRRAVTVSTTQSQFDAMVSLAFNIGVGGFVGSTVVHKLNAGQVGAAADAFMMWVHPPELKRRRTAERSQFLTEGPALAREVAPARPLSPPPTAPASPKLGWVDRLWITLTFRKAA